MPITLAPSASLSSILPLYTPGFRLPARDLTMNDPKPERRWIWFVTGPTASGKTTIAKALADALGFAFVEGDDVRIFFSSYLPILKCRSSLGILCLSHGDINYYW